VLPPARSFRRDPRRNRGGVASPPRLPPAGSPRKLLHVLRLPDFDRADRIGEFCGHPETGGFGELLIDLVEDKAARGRLLRYLAEMEQK
jgi:hypothetical protein